MSDDEFLAAFEDCSLRNGDFHHADHVRMAFLYLSRFPAIEALQRFADSLQRFAAFHGKPERYHETITWAFVFLIRERMSRHAGSVRDWEQFADQNADLLNWKDNILRRYYRKETLASDLARKTFVFPDRLPTGDSELA